MGITILNKVNLNAFYPNHNRGNPLHLNFNI